METVNTNLKTSTFMFARKKPPAGDKYNVDGIIS